MRRAILALAAVGCPIALAAPACSSDEVAHPSYLRVDLIPAETAPMRPRAAHIRVTGEAAITTLCVSVDGPAGAPAASFVLSRDPGKPAADPVTLEITAYDALSGVDGVAPGKEFTCPPTLPPALAAAQVVVLGFCEREARRVSVHVGAECTCGGGGGAGGAGGGSGGGAGSGSGGGAGSGCCAADQTCGAGLTSSGQVCGPDACCSSRIASPCALEGT